MRDPHNRGRNTIGIVVYTALMRNRLHIGIVAFLVMIAFPLPSRATVVLPIQFDEKVEKAAAIVVGQCVASQSSWSADGERILTYSRIRIEKTFKGALAAEITLVTPGGTVGDIRQVTMGVPELRIGRDYVIFVRNSRVGPTILFFEQGLYEIRRNPAGELEVIPPRPQAVIVDSQSGMAIPLERVSTLRQFEGQVREAVLRRENLRMRMIEERRQGSASLMAQIKRNKTLVFLAILGLVLSAWMLFRR